MLSLRPGTLKATRTPCLGVRRGRTVFSVKATANPVAGERYDYVIVGGGTAGCVLANRLSADGSKKVLVLEAGGSSDSLVVSVPAGLTRLFKHPVLDWGLNTVKQNALSSREVYLARGKALGGSSCTNATLYVRGTPSDYDNWGLDGWKSKDLLNGFIAAENYNDGPAPFHGQGGVMNTENPRYQNPLHEEFFRSCAALDIPANPDFNNWSRPQTGYGEFQVAQKQGQRADMSRMYLKPALKRGNLKVVTQARTTKIQFEKSSSGGAAPRAAGVEFSLGDSAAAQSCTAELTPGGEVLMCAGTVHTPQILQLSGIGAASQLQALGIRSLVDLPAVGANLQDHPATLYAARNDDRYDDLALTSEIYDKNYNIKLTAIFKYLFGRRGPLATTGCDHGAFLSTKGSGEPDLQIRFVPAFALDPDAIQSYIIFGELKKSGRAWPCGITMQLLAARSKSRGSVSLRSSDPFAPPAIDLSYYNGEGEADLVTLREGLRIARRIAEQRPLAQYGVQEVSPGPAAVSDADLDDFVRRTTCSGNALVGTCRMGSPSDKATAVSSEDFSVHGVSGLRVIDASIIPRIPGGQTGAAVVLIAERAAQLLTQNKSSVSSLNSADAATSGGKQLVSAV